MPAALDPRATLEPSMESSFEWCRSVSRTRARNFYYGMTLIPPAKRRAMHAVYAWMRAADDLADGPVAHNGRAQAVSDLLEAFREETRRVVTAPDLPQRSDDPNGLMWPAVRKTLRDHRIPFEYLDAMIDGQLLDVRRRAYRTFEELYDYCYKVAGVVGLTCIEVWGYDGHPETRKLAEHRGIAFQLTNILRDLVEDAARGRTYLPGEDFEAFGLSPAQLTERRGGQAFDRFMAFQIQRAQSYYDQSMDLERRLAGSCRAASWAMMRTYQGLLSRIRQNPSRVLRGRVRLSSLRKSSIVLSAACRRAF